MSEQITQIAIICHEANKYWCESNGDTSQKHWYDAPQWQRDSAIQGVRFRLENPEAPAEAMHLSWLQEKNLAGWLHGAVKDEEKKTHPCMVPFEELPLFQQKKDKLFSAIVDALK